MNIVSCGVFICYLLCSERCVVRSSDGDWKDPSALLQIRNPFNRVLQRLRQTAPGSLSGGWVQSWSGSVHEKVPPLECETVEWLD